MEKNEQEKSQEIYDEIVLGMKEWRLANPKAKMRDIEIEVRKRVSRLEAHLIEESALTSGVKEWAGQEAEERPQCPSCGEPLTARGKQMRKLQATGGREVKLERTYGVCPKCETGFSPLDEELGLQSGSLTPRQQEHLVHLSLWMPFRRAVKLLDDVTGVQISEATRRRQTEAAGVAYEALQNERSDQLCGVKQKKSGCSSPQIKKREAETAGQPYEGVQNDQKSHSKGIKQEKSSCSSSQTKKRKAETGENKLLISSDGASVLLVGAYHYPQVFGAACREGRQSRDHALFPQCNLACHHGS